MKTLSLILAGMIGGGAAVLTYAVVWPHILRPLIQSENPFAHLVAAIVVLALIAMAVEALFGDREG